MPYTKNYFIYALFSFLIAYTSYTFLWSRFGLGITSIIQYVLLGLVLLGFMLYLTHTNKNSWTNWLFFVWITQAIAFYSGDSSATTQFKESAFVLLSSAPIISMRYNPKHVKFFLCTMALVSIVMYFVTMSIMRLEDENSYGGGYQILVALPVFLYFFRNKALRTQMIITIVLLVLVLTSMKRGDILACILVVVVYYYIKLRDKKGKIDLRIIVAAIVTAFIGFFAFKYLLATNEIFAWRFEQTIEGDSSNRDTIYSSLWNYYLNAPLNVQLFGGGFDATLKIADARAHSDVLEVLSCEGIIGLIVYMGSFISLFKQMRRRTDVTEKAILASILIIWFVKMIFSMFIFSQPSIILFALTAYILNNRINKQYEN